MNHIFYKYKFTDLSFFIDASFGKYFIPYTEKMDYSDLILNDNGTKFEEFEIRQIYTSMIYTKFVHCTMMM